MIVTALCDSCDREYPAMPTSLMSKQICQQCSDEKDANRKNILVAILQFAIGAGVLILVIKAGLL